MSYNRRVGLMRKILTYWLGTLLIMSSLAMSFGFHATKGSVLVVFEPEYIVSTPFRIDSNADFASSPKVSGGNGTKWSPWIIENFQINGDGFGYCMYIGNTTDYFTIKNCNITYADDGYWDCFFPDAGIALYNTNHGRILNNIIANNSVFGITVYLSEDIIIENNNMDNTGFGISAEYASEDLKIYNNTIINGMYHGISIGTVVNASLLNNTLIHNSIEISCPVTCGMHEIPTTNTVNGKPIYYIKNQISGIVPTGGGEVILANCTGVTVQDQIFSDGSTGIYLVNSHNNVIYNNTIGNMKTVGIIFMECSSNIFTNNLIFNNPKTGVDFFESHDNIISNNCFDNCYTGLRIGYSKGNVVRNNTIKNNAVGMTINDDPYAPPSGDKNIVYHNDFFTNTLQANDEVLNLWNYSYPTGGNYWSNYVGIDLNFDGIGDTAYVFDADNRDYYPLMAPWFPTPPTTYNISLNLGWNFVSIPLTMNDTLISNVLKSIYSQWDVVKYYNSTTKSWKTSRPGSSTSKLLNIDNKMGFWLHTTGACTLRVDGYTPTTTQIILKSGWNEVGYPSSGPNLASVALAGTGADYVSVFQSTVPYVQDWSDLSAVTMESGKGYWVHVPVDTVWTVDW